MNSTQVLRPGTALRRALFGLRPEALTDPDGADRNAPSHAKVPWGRLCSNPTVLLLWLQYFCMSYGWYFYITWLPTYLREARGVSLEKSAILLS